MTNEEALNAITAFVENYACGSDLDGLRVAIEALKEQRPRGEWIEDIRSMICKVNDYYGYTDSMHMFKVLFDQKYHGWKREGETE